MEGANDVLRPSRLRENRQVHGIDDGPRSFRNVGVLSERLSRIDEPHVAPLNHWVRELRTRLGPEAIVPWFDPADGGVNASILWLLEAPGPKATTERGGSGIISCNNHDGTAKNTYELREQAGVDRRSVVHWNVIPFYLGTDSKIRAWDRGDVLTAGPLLRELLALLARVRVVILGGSAAQAAWRDHAPDASDVVVLECPHPSPTNINTRPGAREAILGTWRRAAEIAHS